MAKIMPHSGRLALSATDGGQRAGGTAPKCGTFGMRRFARTLRQDIGAVRIAMLEPWSNGQTEGQINRLKTLKRAMYGRAGIKLLHARMMPPGIRSPFSVDQVMWPALDRLSPSAAEIFLDFEIQRFPGNSRCV
jgi:Transposase